MGDIESNVHMYKTQQQTHKKVVFDTRPMLYLCILYVPMYAPMSVCMYFVSTNEDF
jgi:hypothetical protein